MRTCSSFCRRAVTGSRPAGTRRSRRSGLPAISGGPNCLQSTSAMTLERAQRGVVLTIRRSMTDQEGVGRDRHPFGRTIHCPVRALETGSTSARIEDGPAFRPVDRRGRVSGTRLSGEAVSLILHDRMASAGFDSTGYSAIALEAATSATRARVSTDQTADRPRP